MFSFTWCMINEKPFKFEKVKMVKENQKENELEEFILFGVYTAYLRWELRT